jgi:hypothetical protein
MNFCKSNKETIISTFILFRKESTLTTHKFHKREASTKNPEIQHDTSIYQSNKGMHCRGFILRSSLDTVGSMMVMIDGTE